MHADFVTQLLAILEIPVNNQGQTRSEPFQQISKLKTELRTYNNSGL